MKRIFIIPAFVLATWTLLSGSAIDTRAQWQDFLSREGKDWRVTFQDSGRIRTLYGKSHQRFEEGSIRRYDSLLGTNNLDELRLIRKEIFDSGIEYVYQQHISGIPVAGAEIHFNLDRDSQLVGVTNSLYLGLQLKSGSIFAAAAAKARALRIFNGRATTNNGSLVLIPSGKFAKPAWRFDVAPDSLTEGSRILYVDAADPRLVLRIHRSFATADGQGNIFLENPVVTPTTSTQTFKNMDASTMLAGNFARTYNANFENWVRGFQIDLSVFTTATEASRQYNYNTDDGKFSEAMGYFHINRVHDQWRSFGFNKLNKQIPVFVNVVSSTGKGFDNAMYSRRDPHQFSTGIIIMGAGNKLNNFGHDGDVYYHEYGHAVLDHVKPQFFESMESNYPFAFHEGFSDVSDVAITGNPIVGEFALRYKDGSRFLGRNLDNKNAFPKDVFLPGFGKSESHHTGLIFGGAWWDLQKRIGAASAQRTLYQSLILLPKEMNFFDVRDAMLTADRNKNGGANQAAIQSSFERHGITGSDPGQHGTINITALKTAKLNLTNYNLTLKTTFKKGDVIEILANYEATGLTPGYNLIADEFEVTGPKGATIDAYAYWDEVVNGKYTGKSGALQAEMWTYDNTKTGTYTATLRSRLGGTSQLTETRSVSFKITN
jgi:Fungalysin metallopeptidase (M36)/Fungalysin/Thermolysin Propeptide Motif